MRNRKLGVIWTIRGGAWGGNSTWCFIRSKGPKGSQDGGKQKVLIDFLQHFCDEWGIHPLVTLSDKDFSEINAYSNVFPFTKHQLCFWHCLHVVKKCLAVNGQQPEFYHL